MMVIGVILILLGFLLSTAILTTIGVVLAVIGAVLWILAAAGHAVGSRPHYW